MQIDYKPGNSFAYRMHPMVKGAVAFAAILFFSVHGYSHVATLLAISLMVILALLGGIPLSDVFSSIRRIFILLLVVGLVQGFREGTFNYLYAADAALRIIGVFVAAGIYVTVSSQSELTFFWETCFRPLAIVGIPARELALVMVIAVRFMPVILGEIERIKMAQQARGADIGRGGLFSSAAGLMPLLIPTLTQAILRANELALAMEARGYCTTRQRTRYNRFKFGVVDFFAGLVPLLLIISAVYSKVVCR